MTGQIPQGADVAFTSTGHAQAGADWLDAHFTACQPEYEAMLRSVGLRPGWWVLDAGCGNGVYVPLLAELVGPAGRVTALDLAAEHIAALEDRLATRPVACPVEARVGSLLTLPFPDATFDALWCAAVTQYLTDAELARMLAEARRVVRPGGLVAIKEFHVAVLHFGPADPRRWWRFVAAAEPVAAQVHGALRAADLARWLRGAGLAAVGQRTTLAERRAPLTPVEAAYIAEFLRYFAAIAGELPLPDDDRAFWRDQRGPAALVNDPGFYWCEGHVVAIGRVPGEDDAGRRV